MKVCTDSCAFGASLEVSDVKKALDIGTGTGLLALMLAQRGIEHIDAVEVNHSFADEAKLNVKNSPFSKQINVVESDIREFSGTGKEKYDLIITNPPFFGQSLRSPSSEKNQAKHQGDLNLSSVISITLQLLKPDGRFSIMLPEYESETFEAQAKKKGLFLETSTILFSRPGTKPIRHFGTYKLSETKPKYRRLNIRSENGDYSPEFRSALSDYYLIF